MLKMKTLKRSIGNFVHTRGNAFLKKAFIDPPRKHLFIETSARCNLACRFCAYPKSSPGNFMSSDLFERCVEEALAIGYTHIWLTPMLGEVFADQRVLQKMQYLEKQEKLSSFGFYSNFILATPEKIDTLLQYSKLSYINISLYGHDHHTFEQFSGKPRIQYEKLLKNLAYMHKQLAAYPEKSDIIHFNLSTHKHVRLDHTGSRLIRLLKHYQKAFGTTVSIRKEFDNWAGFITAEDVQALEIDLIDGKKVYKRGACRLLFSNIQIMSDGRVHGCACRDAEGDLYLGDINVAPLKAIISMNNERYRQLIQDQERGHFTAGCRACSFYRSIYDQRSCADSKNSYSLEEALRMID